MDDPDPVAEVFGDLQRMSGHEDRRSACGQLPEEVLDHPDPGRIETDHRFIDDDHPWLVQQGRGDDQPLFHPVGVGLDQVIGPVVEGKLDQEPLGLLTEEPVSEAVQVGDKPHELHAGQLLVKEGPVGNETDDPLGRLRIRGHRDPVDPDRPLRRPQHARHHPDRRRLSRPIGSDETEDLPLRHGEIQVVHRQGASILFSQVGQFDHRSISRISSFKRPISPTRSSWRSASPRTKRMWVTSAGICPRTASAVTQPPRSRR